MSSPTN